MKKIASEIHRRTSLSAKIHALEASSKDRLFRSVEELFSTKGFREISVRDITAHACVHFALAAYYFGGKQALFNETFHSHLAPLLEDGMKRLHSIAKDGRKPSLEEILRAWILPCLRLGEHEEGRMIHLRIIAKMKHYAIMLIMLLTFLASLSLAKKDRPAIREDFKPSTLNQPGWGEDETAWSNQGHAVPIMDNLIAEGKTRPFLIVMTRGMTNDVPIGGLADFNIDPFKTVLLVELIPYIDANFRTPSDQPHRAMAGLSMGGMETKTITLKNLDTFSHIGLFSGGTMSLENVNSTPGFKENVKLVFVGYGSRELGGNRGGFGGDPKPNAT